MKRIILALVLVTAGLCAYAQIKLPEHYPISGTWRERDGRLYQNDEKARLAKVNIPVVQNSPAMIYEFDARYEGGAEDGHGGFGLHFFVDAAHRGESWGAGHSYLLWLNYDENPQNKNIQPGLSAQIYRSHSNSRMELVESFDLNRYANLLTEENLAKPVHFKIIADARTGEIRIYNPVDDNKTYFILNMDKGVLPIKGDWVVLRTNGMRMSFASSGFEKVSAANVLSTQADERLTVWSYPDELGNIIDNYFKKDNRTIQIESSVSPADQFSDRLDSVLPSNRGAPDVFALEAFFIRKYVESDMLMDLTDIYEENKNKLLKYPIDVGTHNGRVYALSWQAYPGAMFYRRSMAKKYLGTDDPQVVQDYFSDFNRFLETARILKDKSDGSCIVVASKDDLFLPFLYARSSPWIVDGQLIIDPAMEEYIDLAKTLYDNRMESRLGQWSDGWFDGMEDKLRDMNGKQIEVFSYFMPGWGLKYVLKENALGTSGDWAMIPGPAPYRWGGTWVAANKNTQNPAAAKELIRYIATNDSFLERYALDADDLVTSLPVIQEIKNRYSEHFLGGQNHYAVFAEIANNVNGRLGQETDAGIENFFKEAVSAYVYGEKSRTQALDDFRKEVQNMVVVYLNSR